MKIYYVDLDIDTNGHLGISRDPFSFDDYVNNPWITCEDVIYLKGSINREREDFIPKGGIIQAWDLNNYGPWRMKVNNLFVGENGNSILSGGILKVQQNCSFGFVGHFVFNVWLDVSGFLYITSLMTFLGCTVKCNAFLFTELLNWVNSIVIKEDFSNTYEGIMQAINSVFNYSEINGTIYNSQINWLSPKTLPLWDASKEFFCVFDLFKDIYVVPQYKGFSSNRYQLDLFGNNRVFVGTGYMPVAKKENKEKNE